MNVTAVLASEVRVGDCVRFSACKPHVITAIEPYSVPGWDNALAFFSGTWSIVVSATTNVRLIDNEGA